MTVSEVISVNKQKCKVFLEEGFAFVLYKSEAAHYELEPGAWISEEAYCQLEENLLLTRAKNKALDFLGFQGRTRQQMRKKLEMEGYPDRIVNRVMGFLEEYRFVDDLAYARNYISLNGEKKSRRQLTQELCLKGVSGEEISRAFEEGTVDDASSARLLLEKRLKGRRVLSYEERCRHGAYLARKGYSYEVIDRVMRQVLSEE